MTVQNTGSTAATPVVKIFIGETEVGTATADAAVAAGESKTILVNVTDASAGEGGELMFTAKAYWTAEGEALATSASNIAITVNAAAPKFVLYQDATPVNDGDDVQFGLVKQATTFIYSIRNEGTKEMTLVSIVAPEGFETTALTDDNKTIAVNGSLNINVTLKAEQGKKSGNLVFTYQVDATTQKTFTLALSGRSIAADTWTVAFNDYSAAVPSDWTNNGWSIAGEYNDNPGAVYTNTATATLMTPRLAAVEGEELTFDVVANYYNSATYAYSSDKLTWSEEVAISGTGEKSFIAPATGNYYIRFTGRGSYLQNFVGFKLNPLEHDVEITTSSVPASGTQYGTYSATVSLRENVGKDETLTSVKLYVDGAPTDAVADVTEAAKNATTVVTLTWTPTITVDNKKAYIEVVYAGGTLTTDEVDLTITEPYTLDETSTDDVVGATTPYEVLVLNRSWVAGYNTVCLPFATTAEEIFGEGAIAYEFAGLIDNKLRFTEVVTMEAGVPYLVQATVASTDETKRHILHNVSIGIGYTTPDKTKVGDITFQGSYAPMAEGTMEGKWGVTPNPSIAEGTATAHMKGFRAYFTGLSTSAEVKGFRFDDGTATGVHYVKMSADEIRDIFDLGGRKLNETRKGINIVNGKKILVK